MNDGMQLASTATALRVVSAEDYEAAGQLVLDISALRKEVAASFDGVIAKTAAAHRQALAAKRLHDDPLREALDHLKTAMLAWARQQVAPAADAVRLPPGCAVPEVMAVAPAPSVEGMYRRETWRAEVVDMKELAQAVASGKVPSDALMPNQPFLNAAARQMRSLLAYPGVAAVKEETLVARA